MILCLFYFVTNYSNIFFAFFSFLYVFVFFFFFQAEDGIRDKLVTGVQTCALPISRARRAPRSPHARRSRRRRDRSDARDQRVHRVSRERSGAARAGAVPPRPRALPRSEERRVGKECRSRWSQCHEKKKKECTMAR